MPDGGVPRWDAELPCARRSFADAVVAESRERTRLLALAERDRQLRYQVEQASTAIRTARDADALKEVRVRLDAVERERRALQRVRRWQEGVLDRCRDRTRVARLLVEDLEQRAVRLREAIRHAEHQAVIRQRAIADVEAQVARFVEELPRLRAQAAETDLRLERLRRELGDVEGV